LPGGEFAGGGQEIGLELFSPKQGSVAPDSGASLEEVIRAARKACKGQAGSDPVPSVSQERQLTALGNPLSGRDHPFCNHGSGMHASGCLPAVGSMPGGMTGENPFAKVIAETNLRESQRQAAALAAGLSPPHQGYVRPIGNLPPSFVPMAVHQGPVASTKQVELEAAASQHAELQQQIQLAEFTAEDFAKQAQAA
jgi:hypothetical protein